MISQQNRLLIRISVSYFENLKRKQYHLQLDACVCSPPSPPLCFTHLALEDVPVHLTVLRVSVAQNGRVSAPSGTRCARVQSLCPCPLIKSVQSQDLLPAVICCTFIKPAAVLLDSTSPTYAG